MPLLQLLRGGGLSNDLFANYVFLSFWGMWGKTGIDIFILISGYFMCISKLTLKRYCKVLFEYLFYGWLIFAIFAIAGYEELSVVRLFKKLFAPFIYANGTGNFMSSFLVFYLFIPFLNHGIKSMNKEIHRNLVFLLLFVFTIMSTFFINQVIFGEVFWFIALYFLAAYLRLYPPEWSNSLRACSRFLVISLILALASVLAIIAVQKMLGLAPGSHTYYFVADAHKLGAVMVSVSLFCFFKNLKIGYSKIINLIAKTTFGILLIHASSDAMRQFLWRDLLQVDVSFALPLGVLILRSVLIVAGVFIVCSLIDMLRIYLVERPFFNRFEKIEMLINGIWSWCKRFAAGLYSRINIFCGLPEIQAVSVCKDGVLSDDYVGLASKEQSSMNSGKHVAERVLKDSERSSKK